MIPLHSLQYPAVVPPPLPPKRTKKQQTTKHERDDHLSRESRSPCVEAQPTVFLLCLLLCSGHLQFSASRHTLLVNRTCTHKYTHTHTHRDKDTNIHSYTNNSILCLLLHCGHSLIFAGSNTDLSKQTYTHVYICSSQAFSCRSQWRKIKSFSASSPPLQTSSNIYWHCHSPFIFLFLCYGSLHSSKGQHFRGLTQHKNKYLWDWSQFQMSPHIQLEAYWSISTLDHIVVNYVRL